MQENIKSGNIDISTLSAIQIKWVYYPRNHKYQAFQGLVIFYICEKSDEKVTEIY